MTSLGGLGCLLMNGGSMGGIRVPGAIDESMGGGYSTRRGQLIRGTFFYKYRGGILKLRYLVDVQ